MGDCPLSNQWMKITRPLSGFRRRADDLFKALLMWPTSGRLPDLTVPNVKREKTNAEAPIYVVDVRPVGGDAVGM